MSRLVGALVTSFRSTQKFLASLPVPEERAGWAG